MSSWARVGVKCVCVDASPPLDASWKYDGLVGKRTYTVVAVITNSPSGIAGVIVREAHTTNPYGYRLDRFRPLVELKDDIAMFKAIAGDTPFHLMVEEGLINLDAFRLDTTPSE